jgi:hypothetical protein
MSTEERLQEWREAEKAACQAEAAVAGLGQGAADPEVRRLYLDAAAAREKADRLFGALLRAIKAADDEFDVTQSDSEPRHSAST